MKVFASLSALLGLVAFGWCSSLAFVINLLIRLIVTAAFPSSCVGGKDCGVTIPQGTAYPQPDGAVPLPSSCIGKGCDDTVIRGTTTAECNPGETTHPQPDEATPLPTTCVGDGCGDTGIQGSTTADCNPGETTYPLPTGTCSTTPNPNAPAPTNDDTQGRVYNAQNKGGAVKPSFRAAGVLVVALVAIAL